MKNKLYLFFVAVISILVLGSTVACHESSSQRQPQLQKHDAASLPQGNPSPRQQAILVLASRLRWYHEADSAEATKPGSTNGDILDIGKRRFVFKTRAALREDLNRVLDSLRRTGPLIMGSVAEATDTLPYKGPSVHTTQSH